MIQRFFVPSRALSGDYFLVSEKDILHQILKVLRMKIGDQIILLDGTEFEYIGTIDEISPQQISGKILEKRKNEAEPGKNVILYQALPKKLELFEWVLQKSTEIGVKKFVPLITERTERRELPKIGRLQSILKEAAEQSGRGIIPELLPPVNFEEIIKKNLDGIKIVFDPSGRPLRENPIDGSSFHIFVGPEGGFSKSEISQAEKNGASIISLGKLTLRTETAGIIGSSLFLTEI